MIWAILIAWLFVVAFVVIGLVIEHYQEKKRRRRARMWASWGRRSRFYHR